MGAHLLGIPAVLLFGLLGWMIERSGRVAALDAWVFVLFGFYLGGTGLGTVLSDVVSTVINAIGGIK